MRLPRWFPYPIAWLKALILSGLIQVAIKIAEYFASDSTEYVSPPIEDPTVLDHPQPWIVLGMLLLLSPAFLIGITHYLIHLLLRFIAPSLQSPVVRKHPIASSMWEGLYGWMVIVAGIILVVAIIAATITTQAIVESPQRVLHLSQFVWFAVAASIYQVEHLIIEAFVLEGLQISKAEVEELGVADVPLNHLRGAMGLHLIKKRIKRKT